MQGTYQIGRQDRILQKTVYSFDVSVWELFWPLATGASLVLSEPGGHRDVSYLAGKISQERITTVHFVPSQLRAYLEEPEAYKCESLRRVICSGEVLPPDVQERFYAGFNAELYNLYGPTEAAVDVSYWKCRRGGKGENVPIGRPIANTQLYVMDEDMELAPVGAVGELYIGGVGVGRGYVDVAELTAERFVPDGYGKQGGRRLYRTGDLARYRGDGSLEFIGRRDHQVKIRGYRIELGEIETALRGCEAVREAVVMAREGAQAEKRLVAYVVRGNEAGAGVEDLRSHLKERLPDYMAPSSFVFLEKMPLTANGKVDRRALPEPGRSRPMLRRELVEPRTEQERILAEIWKRILKLERVGVWDNFFELGGDSILSIQVVARARQAGIEITPRQIFRHQTIAELAEAAGSISRRQAEQGMVSGEAPLTPIQHRFFERRIPNQNYYNQGVLFGVMSEIAPDKLQRVVDKLLEHHDALRMRFREESGGWRQHNLEREERRVFSRIDLSELGDAWGRGLGQAAEQVQESLDLGRGPLMRVVVYEGGEERRLQMVIHHLVVDGVSWRVLLEDLQRGYEQLARGEELKFPAKTTSFRRWAEQQEGHAQKEKMEEEKAYWLRNGWGEVSDLPVDNREGRNLEKDARGVTRKLSVEETEELLKRVPEVYHTQINDVLLTALVRGYRRWSGERSLVVDLEGHGREPLSEEEDVSRTVGWFTTIAPVRLEAGLEGEVGEDLKRVKEELRRMPGSGIGYGMLRYLSDERSREQAGRIKAEVSFNYLGQFDQVIEKGGMLGVARETGGRSVSEEVERSHVLEVSGSVAGGRLGLEVKYSRWMYERERIEELASLYLEELRGIIEHCREEGVGGYTPSDFELVKLSQEEIDRVIGGKYEGD